MSLEDSIKADEEALAKLQEEPKEEIKEEIKEDAPVEEVKEEPKDEPVKEEAPKIDNAAYAKMRIDKAAAEQRARDLEARLAALEKAKQEPVYEADDVETQTVELPPAVQRLVEKSNIESAAKQFASLEQEFVGSGNVPDYQEYINGYTIATYNKIKEKNPTASQDDLRDMTQHQILLDAKQYHIAGINAAEALYTVAKARGLRYVDSSSQQDVVEEKPRAPNLDRVAENKKRSTGMGSAGGSSNEITTLAAAVDMPLSQFAAIPAAELERLERGGR